MLDNQAPSARMAPVDLDVMESTYVPAGDAIEASLHDDNRITWQPAAS